MNNNNNKNITSTQNNDTSSDNVQNNNPLLQVQTAEPIVRHINFSDESPSKKEDGNDE